MSMQTVSCDPTFSRQGNTADLDYDAYLNRVQARFLTNVKMGCEPLFTTDATGAWEAYLAALPAERRQYHACKTCQRFVETYGTLVVIDPSGAIVPAVLEPEDARGYEREAVAAMAKIVRRAKVTGVFLSSDRTWGVRENGNAKVRWRHQSLTPLGSMVFKKSVLTAEQKAAEKREDFKTVMRALEEFNAGTLDTALRLLRTDALYRSEKVLGQAEWLRKLHELRDTLRGPAQTNVVWRAVALAPAGFCHPRSSMIGTLLEDIVAGMDFETVSRRFAAKMHPLQYQRPQAAPTAGAIAAAEKLVETMGIRRSLERRFARLDEVEAIWRPAPAKTETKGAGGVFGHLQPKGAAEKAAPAALAGVPPVVMTFEKFRRTVMPSADRIEFFVPPGNRDYIVLVTAVHADAAPIMQWDIEGNRNPVSWYRWNGGSNASGFGLNAGRYCEVESVILPPHAWKGGEGKFSHFPKEPMFALAGAQETRMRGNALFPEILKSELHGARSVIEAYARSAVIEGLADGPHVVGASVPGAKVRETAGEHAIEYTIDRLD